MLGSSHGGLQWHGPHEVATGTAEAERRLLRRGWSWATLPALTPSRRTCGRSSGRLNQASVASWSASLEDGMYGCNKDGAISAASAAAAAAVAAAAAAAGTVICSRFCSGEAFSLFLFATSIVVASQQFTIRCIAHRQQQALLARIVLRMACMLSLFLGPLMLCPLLIF